MTSIIQGSFPHGLTQIAARGGVAQPHVGSPDWVQQRIAAGRGQAAVTQPRIAPNAPARAPQASPVQMTPTGSAVLFPPQLPAPPTAGGQPLPQEVRQKMESFFRTSFADVRIHAGGTHAQSLGAVAFTHGSNIHFAHGQYDPSTPRGQQILAHELAHVVQQRANRVRSPFPAGISIVQDRVLEAEAESMGRRAADHRPPTQAPVQRKVYLEGRFNAWKANAYTRAAKNFLASARQEYGAIEELEESSNTHLTLRTESPNKKNANIRTDRDNGVTELKLRWKFMWYDIESSNEKYWSTFSENAPADIRLTIRDNMDITDKDGKIEGTLAHEWAVHGEQYYWFIKNVFRKRSTETVLKKWKEANEKHGYLNTDTQHKEIGERKNSGFRALIKNMQTNADSDDLAEGIYANYLHQVNKYS